VLDRPWRAHPFSRAIVRVLVLLLAFAWTRHACTQATDAPRRLNNLVTELLHVAGPEARAADSFSFENPREGWVLFRSRAVIGARTRMMKVLCGTVRLRLDGSEVPLTWHREYLPATLQAMRWLPKGAHTLRIDAVKDCSLEELTVRAIPEIIFAHYRYDPWVREFGPYDWEGLRKMGVLDAVNVLTADHGDSHLLEWTLGAGKHVLRTTNPPGTNLKDELAPEEAFQAWAETDSAHPLHHGIIVDEFGPNATMKVRGKVWIEGIRRFFTSRPGRLFYPYIYGDPEKLREFVEPLLDTPCRFAYERYLLEMPTEASARARIERDLVRAMEGFRKYAPGFQKRCVIVMGLMCAPPASFNVEPLADYKTYLDMQMNVLATHPAYDGLFGVQLYSSGYCDEEMMRWWLRLVRHYCIEGKTGRLSEDPYELNHIRNPDFAEGLEGWTVAAAGPDTVTTGHMTGYRRLEGRFGRGTAGDDFLLMTRRAERPNVVAQEMQGLRPARYYSVKLVVGDLDDLTRREIRPCSVRIENADIVPALSFRGLYRNSYALTIDKYGQTPTWFNLIRIVFKARSQTARLVISDWASDTEPGGRIGQRLTFNFIQVEPYFMPEDSAGE